MTYATYGALCWAVSNWYELERLARRGLGQQAL
jgi:hypothetical protein